MKNPPKIPTKHNFTQPNINYQTWDIENMDEILPNRSNEITIKGNDYFETVAQEDGSILVSPKWISIKDKPPANTDVLLTDDERCWVGKTFDNLDFFLASHPDYDRHPKNEYGAPFITCSKPTHWMPLPKPPAEK